ncbi:MAG: CoA transferase, partial [Pseudomonadales bacterium]
MFNLLEGVRIIDLTTIVLGPYATQLLADFGAEVIKVESEQGDVFRAVRPGRCDDIGTGFMNFNRNKRSIILDLKSEAGKADLRQLVTHADVLVHNMRPNSAERLGASYEA